eukprot:IDg740t1
MRMRLSAANVVTAFSHPVRCECRSPSSTPVATRRAGKGTYIEPRAMHHRCIRRARPLTRAVSQECLGFARNATPVLARVLHGA